MRSRLCSIDQPGTVSDAELAALALASYAATPTWQRGATAAVVSDVRGSAVVAIPGTASIGDVLCDLYTWPAWRWRLGWCHSGYLRGALALLPHVLALDPARPVNITGHSLGGAEAILLASLLTATGRPPARLVTFGAPRCGLWALGRVLRRVSVRQYRNLGDVVPALPAVYRHVRPLTPLGPEIHWPLHAHAIATYASRLA